MHCSTRVVFVILFVVGKFRSMSALVETDDETSQRRICAREILATARALLVGHVPRDRRVAEALALARSNIRNPIERQAEVWRRERIKRELGDARATLEQVAHIKPDKIVLKIKENAHVAPEAPDPKPQPPPRERGFDATSTDWEARIRDAIERERQFQHEVLAEVIAETRAKANDDLKRATRSLNAELADLKATLAELRVVLATDQSRPLDLPNPLRSHRAN